METITVVGNDVYEYHEEDEELRTYIIKLIGKNGYVSTQRIHTKSFDDAYKYAVEYLEDTNVDRIISIAEVVK